MNQRKLSDFFQNILNFPGCWLVFIPCASATIGLLYLRTPFEVGVQYLPAVASMAYFISRSLFMLNNGLSLSKNEIIGYLFFFSVALSMGLQLFLEIDAIASDGRSALDFTLASWAFSNFYLFAGASCTRASYSKSNIVAIVLLLLVVVPFIAAPKQAIFIDYWQLRQETGKNDLTHLIIAEWCVFLIIGSFAFAKNTLRPIIIVAAAIVLFGLQGRSSTVFTLFSLLSFWMLTGGKKVVLIYAGIAIEAAVAVTTLPISDLMLGANDKALDRMLLDSEDNSLEGRTEGLKNSIEHLPNSILFGDPTYIAIEAGGMGSYIHNILSMWQFFGLLPFLLVLYALYRSVMAMRARLRKGNLSVMEEMGCMLLIYAIVGALLSKSILSHWLWFSVGYWMFQYSKPARQQRSNEVKKRKRRRRSSKWRSSSLGTS